MELLFYVLMFYLILGVHFGLMFLLNKILKIDVIIVIISVFFSLFFSCLGFWEIYTTSNVVFIHDLGFNSPISPYFYNIGFYGIQCLSVYAFAFIFYIYHLKQKTKQVQKLKLLGFVFLLMGIQLLSGMLGDFMYFVLKGLEFFNSSFATWLSWENGIPLGYIAQISSGLYFLGLSIFIFWLNTYFQKHKKI